MASKKIFINDNKNIELRIKEDGYSILNLINRKDCKDDIKGLFKTYDINSVVLWKSFSGCIFEVMDENIQSLIFRENKKFDFNLVYKFKNLRTLNVEFTFDMTMDFSRFFFLTDILEVEYNPNMNFIGSKSLRRIFLKFFDNNTFDDVESSPENSSD